MITTAALSTQEQRTRRGKIRGFAAAIVAVALVGNFLLTVTHAEADSACPWNVTNNILSSGSILYGSSNQYLCSEDATSQNKAFTLVMQSDGNLVIYVGRTKPIWALSWIPQASNPSFPSQRRALVGGGASYAIIQSGDGNFVVYGGGQAIWATMTSSPGDHMAIDWDGQAAVWTTGNSAIWASGSSAQGHTIAMEGGDCWDAAVRECTQNHNGLKDSYVYFEAIDYTGQSGWTNALKAAAHAWDVYPSSPQYYNYCTGPRTGCVYTPNTSDMYVYLHTTTDNSVIHNVTIQPGTNGITFFCSGSTCQSNFDAGVTQWAEIYLDATTINQSYYTDNLLQNIAAHEMGHSIGLAHNWSTSSKYQSVMYPYTDDANCGTSCGAGGPTGLDIGGSPGCSGYQYGVDCIFGFQD